VKPARAPRPAAPPQRPAPPLVVELRPAAAQSEPAREVLLAFLRRRIERGRARLGSPKR